MAQIDFEELEQLTIDADKIFLSAKGEKVLVRLLEIEKQVEEAIATAKIKLEEAARKVNPNFSSIQADKVKVYYRAYGAKYYIDDTQLNLAPKELYTATEKVVYTIDTKGVDKWVDAHGGMPAGIKEVERKNQLTFALKASAREENGQ